MCSCVKVWVTSPMDVFLCESVGYESYGCVLV